MRLGVKLLTSYLFVVVLVAIVGIISRSYNRNVNEVLKQENTKAAQTVEHAFNMEGNLYVTLRLLQELNDNYANQSTQLLVEKRGIGLIKADLNTEFEQLYTNYVSLRNIRIKSENLANTEVQFLEDLKDKLIRYQGFSDSIVKELETGNTESAQQVYTITLVPYFDNNIRPLITTLRDLVKSEQELMVSQLDESLKKVDLVTLWATLIAFFIALSVVLLINASIVRPMDRLSKASLKIGQGDLDHRIPVTSADEVGQLSDSFNIMVENLKKRTISRDFLDNIIESMQEALLIVDDNQVIDRVNNAAVDMIGYEIDDLLGKKIEDIELKIPSGNKIEETKLTKSDGKKIDVAFTTSELNNPYGDGKLRLFVISDITERKHSEEQIRNSLEEKKVLLAEIHHRVKNNLAVISGLLQMQSWNIQSDEAKKVLYDSQLRVQSIALVHEMLYESDSLAYIQYDKYINDLLTAISSMYMETGLDVNLESDVQDIELTINQAIPVSLLLNEVIVNAYKHAFNTTKKGTIKVVMKNELNKVIIVVTDDGDGIDEKIIEQPKLSLGMTLIRTLTKQIDANYKIENMDEGGTKVEIDFILDY